MITSTKGNDMKTINFHGKKLFDEYALNYYTVDRDGTVYGWEDEPFIDGPGWNSNNTHYEYLGTLSFDQTGRIGWKESLVEV